VLQDNARTHTANQTVKTVNEFGYELMEHPPYSPDLVPSYFHMFGPVKEALKEEVIGGMQNWLKTHPKNFNFLTKLKNLRTAGTGALKSRGILLESNISFVSIYLK
jgi:histone-lysine N-methyltransferase SETMAR